MDTQPTAASADIHDVCTPHAPSDAIFSTVGASAPPDYAINHNPSRSSPAAAAFAYARTLWGRGFASIKRWMRQAHVHLAAQLSLRHIRAWYNHADREGKSFDIRGFWTQEDWWRAGWKDESRFLRSVRWHTLAFPVTLLALMYLWFAYVYEPQTRVVDVQLFPAAISAETSTSNAGK